MPELNEQQFDPLLVTEIPLSSVDVGCSDHRAACYHRDTGHASHGWEGGEDEMNYVQRMAADVDSLPPAILQKRDESYDVWAGAHRLAAHREAGRSTMRSRVIPEQVPRKDVMGYIDLYREDD